MTAWYTRNFLTCLLTSLESIPMTKSTWISNNGQMSENLKNNVLQTALMCQNIIIWKTENNVNWQEWVVQSFWNKTIVFVNNIEEKVYYNYMHLISKCICTNRLVGKLPFRYNSIFKSVHTDYKRNRWSSFLPTNMNR